MEVIESGFGIVVIPAVAQGVGACHASGLRKNVAPCVILIGSNLCATHIDELHDVALEVQDVVIRFRLGAQLVDHGERLARLVIDEIEHCLDRAVRSDRLAHDLAALRQVFVRDRLRRGQVRAPRRDSILILYLGLNRLAVRQEDDCSKPNFS